MPLNLEPSVERDVQSAWGGRIPYTPSMNTNSKKKNVPTKPKAPVPKKQGQPRATIAPAATGLAGQFPEVYMRSLAPSRPGSSIRVEGCDYIGLVNGGASAADNIYGISSTNATTFPRLNNIAKVFEQFAFNRLSFRMIGDAGSNLAGSYTGVVVYEDQSSAFTSAQIRNEEKATTRKFWENGETVADCKRARLPWFSPLAADSADGNFGDFHLFTDAAGGTVPVVHLFVCYDVDFAQGQASTAPELSKLAQAFLVLPGANAVLEAMAVQVLDPKVLPKLAEPMFRHVEVVPLVIDDKMIDLHMRVRQEAPKLSSTSLRK